MFEFIKVLVETVVRSISIPAILEHKEKKRLSQIGCELFYLYVSLNEIVLTGRQIVDNLEAIIPRMRRALDAGHTEAHTWTTLRGPIFDQRQSIFRFLQSVHRLSYELQVIAPEVYLKIVPLVTGKQNALQILSQALGFRYHGEMRLLYADEDQLLQVMEQHKGIELGRIGAEVFQEVDIENLDSIEVKKLPVLQAYLDHRKPKEALAAIEVSALALRQAIADNFSIQDLLLGVNDTRSRFSDSCIPSFEPADRLR